MNAEWVAVYTSRQQHEVEIIKSILEDHDIQSVTIDKRDSIYVTVGEIEVFVKEQDAILAKIIIDQAAL